MIIEVNRSHIRKGKQRNCFSCPIALAIKDKIKDASVVLVSNEYIRVYWPPKEPGKPNHLTMKILPHQVSQFIRDFDNDHKVKPFKFDLVLT